MLRSLRMLLIVVGLVAGFAAACSRPPATRSAEPQLGTG